MLSHNLLTFSLSLQTPYLVCHADPKDILSFSVQIHSYMAVNSKVGATKISDNEFESTTG